LTKAVLEDWRTAPIDEKLRATLGFLEKITLSPEDVGPADADVPRRAGVSDSALIDAVYVCTIFNVIDRISDALDFAIPSADEFNRQARILLKRGYA
jgi:alkylhydroperoxidase family enzyme